MSKVKITVTYNEPDDEKLHKTFKTALPKPWLNAKSDKLRDVKTTSRLVGSPAVITQHESATLRRMMQQVDQAHSGEKMALPRQQLEIKKAETE